MVLIVVRVSSICPGKRNTTDLPVWLMSGVFFKSNESMEASCQALSKTRAESIRVFIHFLISPSLWLSDVAQQNR